MFERFTDDARRAMLEAQEQAKSLGHTSIEPYHLMLALLNQDRGLIAAVFTDFSLEFFSFKNLIETEFGVNPIVEKHIPFADSSKKVLEYSLREALALGNNFIGTEHLLLGLTRDQGNIICKLLNQIHIEPDKLRSKVIELASAQNDEKEDSTTMAGNIFGRQQSQSKDAMLLNFSRNLTALASEGKLDKVSGRELEIERILQILGRRSKNNPILIGEPGVGKTAVIEGLALAISKNLVPEFLLNYEIFEIDLAGMLAGTRYRGDFEERLKKTLKEIMKKEKAILFIDEIHTITGAGSGEGATLDAANMLKPLLARGELKVIGATTLSEFRKHIEKDAALERRFQPVMVNPPSNELAVKMLQGVVDDYAKFHKVSYTDSSLVKAVELSDRYIQDRFLPDKAIDLIDEAGAYLQMTKLKGDDIKPIVNDEVIATIISKMTGVPLQQLTSDELERLKLIEEELSAKVIGQNEAIRTVAKSVRRFKSGLKDPKRPSGSFIFAGPSGVGKTETAKALARFLFGSDDSMIVLDMSEYSEQHSISKLIGSPPGYVGFDDGGGLTERVRRSPFSLILFDEIEKAHPEIFNTLLQVLEEGRLTDASGREVNFKNTTIIMTTNLGSQDIVKGQSAGFSSGDMGTEYANLSSKVREALKSNFRPEFLNRVDEVVVFPPLTQEDMESIAKLMLKEVENKLNEQLIDLVYTSAAISFLAEKGYDKSYGARPLRRLIQTSIEDLISDLILSGGVLPTQTVIVDAVDKKLTVNAVSTTAAPEITLTEKTV
jgi:ATP-dependent Clp protease ATP-binding subunit ClpC